MALCVRETDHSAELLNLESGKPARMTKEAVVRSWTLKFGVAIKIERKYGKPAKNRGLPRPMLEISLWKTVSKLGKAKPLDKTWVKCPKY